ncbi:MAG: protein kinase [Prochloraceae cyanobacterium]|nr:protein kinase [Prochloraceae cyanobacterium]
MDFKLDDLFIFLDYLLTLKELPSLDYREKEIIKQNWDDKIYEFMNIPGCTVGFVKSKLAPDLWKKLSKALCRYEIGKINKKNMRDKLIKAYKIYQELGLKGEIIYEEFKIIEFLDSSDSQRKFNVYLVEYLDYFKCKSKLVLKEFLLKEENKRTENENQRIERENERIQKEFRRELDFLIHFNYLSCPHIPKLSLYQDRGNKMYLTYKWIESEKLSKYIPDNQPNNSWSEAEVIALLKELLNILVWLKKGQTIHRDIKPSNLIRTPDSRIVLINFEKATRYNIQEEEERVDQKTHAHGTYIAPEQAFGFTTFSSDIYSVGIICIQALTGIPPKKLKITNTGEIIWTEKVKLASEIEGILNKMVCRSVKDRYDSPEELLQDLKKIE